MMVRIVDHERGGTEQQTRSVDMRLRVKVQKNLPSRMGDGGNEYVMVQSGVNPVGWRPGECAVAACGSRAGEKRR